MTYKEKVAWLQRYLKAREKANFLGDCVQEMEAEAQGMRTRLDGMPGAGRDTARLPFHEFRCYHSTTFSCALQ